MNNHTYQKPQSSTPVVEISSFKPLKFRQRGKRKIAIPTRDAVIEASLKKFATNRALLHALARAFYWERLIDQGVVISGSEIATKEGLDPSTVNEYLRLTLLSPVSIEMILNGTQPAHISIKQLTKTISQQNWTQQFKSLNHE